MAAKRRLATSGSGVIQRTWLVYGRGGKLHVGAEGNWRSALSSRHVLPPSSERESVLGSVPAYTTPSLPARSVRLTATEVTDGCSMPAPTCSQLSPAFSLRQIPDRRFHSTPAADAGYRRRGTAAGSPPSASPPPIHHCAARLSLLLHSSQYTV